MPAQICHDEIELFQTDAHPAEQALAGAVARQGDRVSPDGTRLAPCAICRSCRDGSQSNFHRRIRRASACPVHKIVSTGVLPGAPRFSAARSRERSFSEDGVAPRRSFGRGRSPIAFEKIPPRRARASSKIDRAPSGAITVGGL